MRIGFIGLGHMGLPMATNLVNAGFAVTGYDLQSESLEKFANAGGLKATSIAELATDQDVLITMLQTGEQVKAVCLGTNGLFAHASAKTLFIDCSSIDVQSSRELHQQAENHHMLSVDAPVSGGVRGAESASLTVMIGGSNTAFEKARTILCHIGKTLIHTGEPGSGQAAKICNNMILGISMIAISEAFVLAKQLGLTPQKLFEVVTNASGQCWAMSHYAPVPGVLENVPANHGFQPGFTAAMMLKDLRLSQNSADSVGVNTPLGKVATELYAQFNCKKNSLLDFSAIIQLIELTTKNSSA